MWPGPVRAVKVNTFAFFFGRFDGMICFLVLVSYSFTFAFSGGLGITIFFFFFVICECNQENWRALLRTNVDVDYAWDTAIV